MDSKLIIGIVIGFTACWFIHKRNKNANKEIEDKFKKVQLSIKEFLQSEVDLGKEYDVEKVSNDILQGKRFKTQNIANFGGISQKLFNGSVNQKLPYSDQLNYYNY